MKKKLTAIFLAVAAALALASCAQGPPLQPAGEGPPVRVISMGPSITEILVELGAGERIVGADEHSFDIAGLPEDIPLFMAIAPDAEQLLAAAPDLIFVMGMLRDVGEDPFRVIENAGVRIVDIPTSTSLSEIMEDIRLIAEVMGVEQAGEEIIKEMEAQIRAIRAVGEGIDHRKTVYFELEGLPQLYSFGQGVFLNEMLELIGAENIFADETGWLAVSGEAVLAANPAVILTNAGWVEDPVGEILFRPGWEAVPAVENGAVYFVDTNASSRPSHRVIDALWQMAGAVYPDAFGR